MLLLSACSAEWRVADERLAGVSPAIGMGVLIVVVVQELPQSRLEVLSRTKVALCKEPATENPEPKFDLIEPTAVLGREMEHVLVRWVAQKRSPFLAAPQRLCVQRDIAPLGDQRAYRQAPVRVEVVQNPMVTVHFGEVIGGVAKMGDEIVTGSRRAQIPRHLSRRHGERREQSTGAMTDVLILASPSFPRLGLLGRVLRAESASPSSRRSR